MKQIPLTKGQFALVDDEDYDDLVQFKWFVNKGYANRYVGVVVGVRKQEGMHRRITEAPKGMDVDHVNMDPLDNTRSNLRICTRTQNMMNKRRFSNNTSGYTGIVQPAGCVCWFAAVKSNGNKIAIGGFRTKEQAAICRDLWVRDMHGDFAQLNFKPAA